MRTLITLYLALVFTYAALFWVVGDFTPYLGGDFGWVYVPTAAEQTVEATKVALVLAPLSTLLVVAGRKVMPGHRLLRLFLAATLTLSAGLYFHGDLFKMWLGYPRGGEMCEVKSEDPYGPWRLLLSFPVAVFFAGLMTGGAAACLSIREDHAINGAPPSSPARE